MDSAQTPVSGNFDLVRRLATLLLVVAIVGLPISGLLDYAVVVVSAILLFTGTPVAWSFAWRAAIVLTALLVAAQALLAPPKIDEGHNIFLTDGAKRPLEAVLPADVFRFMQAKFDARFPPGRRCDSHQAGCWRGGGFPNAPYAFSGDGVFQKPAFSRRVDGIDFSDPVWLRLGAINGLRYNWYTGTSDVARVTRDRRFWRGLHRWHLQMPWYVAYRFPADYTGSSLCWRDDVLWPTSDRTFTPIHHADWSCRAIAADDIGRRIFGVAIAPDSLAMNLTPPPDIRARALTVRGLKLGGAIAILVLLLHLRLRALVVPGLLAGLALLAIAIDDASFVGGLRPFDGGDDGLFYAGTGRDILQHALAGNIAAALEGGEKVFYYGGPGLRYFRALEMVLFGDTNLGLLSLVLLLPFVLLLVLRRLLPLRWALALTLMFVAVPVGALFGTTFFQYATLAARGYADPVAYILFVCAIVPIIGAAAAGPGNRFAPAFGGVLLMALSLTMKPIVAPAIAVMLGGAGLSALIQSHWKRLAGLCLGFVPAGGMALHNWYFGGVFVPFSANAGHPLVFVMPPSAYAAVFGELLQGNFAGEHVQHMLWHLTAWLSGPSGLAALAPLGALALVLLIYVAGSRRFDPWLRVIAVAALAQQAVGLFYIATARYHLLAWLLTGMVVVVWFQTIAVAWMQRRWPDGWRRAAALPVSMRIVASLAALQQGYEMRDQSAPASAKV